jgi:hypothetical protein
MPGTQALGIGGVMVVVFGGITLAAWSNGGPLWKASIPVAIGLGIFAMGLTARIRSVLLWRTGEVCEGEVIHAYTRENIRGAGDGPVIIHGVQYEYVVDGIQYVARHGTLGTWTEGPIWVIYDANNPNRSMPERGS